MEAILKILIGLLLVAVSLSYLYRPGLVLKVNALVRNLLFSDVFLLHYRRRLGILAFVAAVLFLYSGFRNLGQSPRQAETSGYDEMNEAYRYFYLRRFDDAIRLATDILRNHPSDPHALFLLKQARAGKTNAVQPSTSTVRPHR